MSIKKAIEQRDHETVLKLAEEALAAQPTDDLLLFLQHTKLVALINLEKFDQAQQYLRSIDQRVRDAKDAVLPANYLTYKAERFEEVAAGLRKAEYATLSTGFKLLLAQSELKLENYLTAFKLFWGLHKEKSLSDHLAEDVVINTLNCLVMFLLTEEAGLAFSLDEAALRAACDLVSLITGEQQSSFSSREAQINSLLLFIVIEKLKPDRLYQFYKRSTFNFQEQSRRLLDGIAEALKAEGGNSTGNASAQELTKLTGHQLEDQLTLFALRTFVMQRNQEVSWSHAEIQAIEKLLFEEKHKITDDQLRISLISFLAFIHSISENREAAEINKLLSKIDEELRGLSRNSRRSAFLSRQLNLNKIVLLLHTGNVIEARRVTRSDLRINERHINYALLPMETQMIVSNKNQKELDTKLACFEADRLQTDPQYTCVFYLLQLAVYYAWNNQKRYSDVFAQFVNEFFIKQLSLDSSKRFLTPNVFTQFSKNMVFYMIRNNLLMKNLEDRITNFIEFITDPGVVLKMANHFVEKRNYPVAEKILSGLASRDPTNERVRSRLNYVYSVTNPHLIDESLLPQFETVKDLNSLRSLENDFVSVIRSKASARSDTLTKKMDEGKLKLEKKASRRIKKKYRIRWPKNFDFERPGPRPDPERWLPKYERKKYLKRAIKEGKLTKTQGVTTAAGQNKELFRAEHSTAAQQTVKGRGKRK